jgi:hypothetical protein
MIYNYSEWIKESEKVEPSAPADAGSIVGGEPDLTPAQMEEPLDEPDNATQEEPSQVEDIDDSSDIGKFKKLGKARKEAAEAFKNKQEEFLSLPKEERSNSPLKDELVTLHKALKDAESEFNSFNEEMLGGSDDDIEPEY